MHFEERKKVLSRRGPYDVFNARARERKPARGEDSSSSIVATNGFNVESSKSILMASKVADTNAGVSKMTNEKNSNY